jgi:hypothetical protein
MPNLIAKCYTVHQGHMERLKAIAVRSGLSVSACLRLAVSQFLAREEQPSNKKAKD